MTNREYDKVAELFEAYDEYVNLLVNELEKERSCGYISLVIKEKKDSLMQELSHHNNQEATC